MRTWLIQRRREVGLSQYAVAKAADMSQSYYASIESGARGQPLRVTAAKAIAAVLGFDWTRFYADEDDGAERV